jgi:hypothetical protein
MKKVLLCLVVVCISLSSYAQTIKVTPNGLMFFNDETFLIKENEFSQKENIDNIISTIKSNYSSQNIKIELLGDQIFIKDFITGYTKTDKMAGSAYLLDLSYSVTIDVEDNKIRIHIPIFDISANQKYESNVSPNKGVQFTMTMGIKGKNNVWNSRNKQLFIYNEKDKLIEKTTKEKLEKDLSKLIDIIVNSKKSDW